MHPFSALNALDGVASYSSSTDCEFNARIRFALCSLEQKFTAIFPACLQASGRKVLRLSTVGYWPSEAGLNSTIFLYNLQVFP